MDDLKRQARNTQILLDGQMMELDRLCQETKSQDSPAITTIEMVLDKIKQCLETHSLFSKTIEELSRSSDLSSTMYIQLERYSTMAYQYRRQLLALQMDFQQRQERYHLLHAPSNHITSLVSNG
jgi:hypothetical protein